MWTSNFFCSLIGGSKASRYTPLQHMTNTMSQIRYTYLFFGLPLLIVYKTPLFFQNFQHQMLGMPTIHLNYIPKLFTYKKHIFHRFFYPRCLQCVLYTRTIYYNYLFIERRFFSRFFSPKIRFGWVGFYVISTFVGYLMPNPLYTYILNIYDLVWLGFMAHQPL